MTPPIAPLISIMKAGTHTDVNGISVTFTRTDLSNIAASYSPKSDPAPLVIGHPQLHEPAYGWVESLEAEGDTLRARTEKLEPAFAELVRDGRYRKVSASFYAPAQSANPKPGGWYLRHIGFLGAAAPAVKGLGTVAFASPASRAITVEVDTPRPAMFAVPPGYRIQGDNLALMERATALQSASPTLSFVAAVEQARREAAMVSLSEQTSGPAERRRIATAVRASQLQAQYPGLSFGEAMDRARGDLVFSFDAK